MPFSLPPPPGINEFRSASWQDWFFKLRTALIEAFSSISALGVGIPPLGTTRQALAKDSSTDYDVSWQTFYEIPAAGSINYVLTKNSATDYDVSWKAPTGGSGLPIGGTIKQALAKIDSVDFNVSWQTFYEIPAAGSANYVLTKNTGTDYDVSWKVLPNDLPTAGAANYVLTKNTVTDYDVSWKAVSATNGLPIGGTLGQYLRKKSSTDYDADWQSFTAAYSPGNNLVHNAHFQVRNKTTHEYKTFSKTSTPSFHAYRWYGVAPSGAFDSHRTNIITDNDQRYITIERVGGVSLDPVRLVQILDTEDSKKFAGTTRQISASVTLIGEVTSCTFKVSIGTGVDQSMASYIAGTWTGQTVVESQIGSGINSFDFPSNTSQIAFEISVIYKDPSGVYDVANVYAFLVEEYGSSSTYTDSRCLASVQHDCHRYYRELELYLTTTPINIPICMRDVPTVTLGDAAVFYTTDTTKDNLIIYLDDALDEGLHTVYLDCEL